MGIVFRKELFRIDSVMSQRLQVRKDFDRLSLPWRIDQVDDVDMQLTNFLRRSHLVLVRQERRGGWCLLHGTLS